MYAVIRSGGKQERVAEGQRVRVELLGQPVGAEVALEPVLVVDGDRVAAALRNALSRDKTRTQVFDISELGLVEMTRKRISEGPLETLSTECTICGGRGVTLDDSVLR